MKTPPPQNITKRELEIIRLLATGLDSQSISRSLQISLLTVQTHRRNIIRKLKVKNAAQVVSWAYANGDLLRREA